ncbi:hypothetical protein WG68_02225 [Arsukibacterium ikkense]|uniref:Nucleotidyl transferase domain-containing protein n=1 Tax=Arsukibacterium ikkense TaxID=336831 RepID=A0A0M2V8P5_9GAMM|nr:sugar phosphate nucleotidyltransferase [Arsukibacterium ikkense]KKO46789.1 hypothetical protein WG68_02225 [Arsukibacterium ikkense]
MTAGNNGLNTQSERLTSDVAAEATAGQANTRGEYWAIVLAGGRGENMNAAGSEGPGRYRPKQFCRLSGALSMLQYTWGRARQIVASANIVTVSVTEQVLYFEEMGENTIPGTVLYQPEHNGTAAAVYLALAHILALDPDASVLIMPSDHYIFPEARFVALASEALAYTSTDPERVVLLGAESRWPNQDFGWIETTTGRAGASLQPVLAFVEKPDTLQVQRLFSNHALWSTMIIAVKGELLWQLARALQPKFYLCFLYLHRLCMEARFGNSLRESMDTAIGKTFQHMPALDFSNDILQHITRQCRVLPMTDIDWDDWGRPERILQSLERYGLDSWFNQPHRSIR